MHCESPWSDSYWISKPFREQYIKFGVLLALMGGACTKTKLEGAIAHWTLPSAGSRDKRVTLAACADEPLGQPFDHSRWTAVLQVR